ncbi:MAG: glycosyltransferase family 2 protein [Candidatus Colwellbacteria bacterium]|nr:glycosyltransferase family 2 protein [Candidatus Colwellbacteria bacterium]
MENKPYLSVIIPAWNEADAIADTLADIDKHLQSADFDYEIVVVNDGSSDNTADIVQKLEPAIKGLRLLDNKINKGKGKVVRQGMLDAKGKFRLFTDADNSTSVDHFFKMIPYLEGSEGKKYDVVIGSRDIKGAKLVPPQPFYRRALGNIGNIIIQIFLLPGLKDTQCGFKCFSEEVAEKVFPIMRINRWAIDVEALSLAKAMKYGIKEIPVTWVNRFKSRVGLRNYLGVLRDVLKIRFWLWTDSYKIKKSSR